MASKNMKDISNLLKNLKFRKKMFGGIDEKDVWRKLDELQEEYQNVYDAKGTAKEAEDIDDVDIDEIQIVLSEYSKQKIDYIKDKSLTSKSVKLSMED